MSTEPNSPPSSSSEAPSSPTSPPSSSSHPPVQPPPPPSQKQPAQGWLSKPYIDIRNSPPGPRSHSADERCFTYCSQTSRGRSEGREPYCRSLCIRRVFAHEVEQLIRPTAEHENDTADPVSQSQSQPQSQQHQSTPKKGLYKLPMEGQTPRPAEPAGPSNPVRDLDAVMSGDDQPGLSSSEGEQRKGLTNDRKGAETRYWEDGWYVWYTKNRSAAQEHIGLMRHDLRRQTGWQERKEDMVKGQGRDTKAQQAQQAQAQDQTGEKKEGASPPPPPPPRQPPRPTIPPEQIIRQWEESTLIRLPPPIPFIEPVRNLLAPTGKALDILKQNYQSGSFAILGDKLWEKAWSPEPFLLASNACKKMWEKWKEGPPSDS
ncbi:hypothetical protein CONPUDRAFT_166177 [Coniophora puteana RWD-64-598 SS2]|uniref:Uncharacterized protein n=1 Tax=Coniophora puteana (strain RWD-64-598) TaxID=741705 RepID=A0A5M3MNY7_CONPW|nr:uncharacterized protein CONPUDRAFT_166177 [Coniophora puteana RWD-64-598 SS2]EIW80757.1 hypothetical protein CONPUDRAFT_166177 [Coniophora puteana RWD-64-598 SS2]